jgi:hypothetical protein
MDSTTTFIILDLPLLMLGAGVLGTIAWNRNGTAVAALGRASPVGARLLVLAMALAAWFVLTVTSVWLAFLYGFFLCHLLLFWVGRLAAGAGLILLALLILSIPLNWGWLLLRPAIRR